MRLIEDRYPSSATLYLRRQIHVPMARHTGSYHEHIYAPCVHALVDAEDVLAHLALVHEAILATYTPRLQPSPKTRTGASRGPYAQL